MAENPLLAIIKFIQVAWETNQDGVIMGILVFCSLIAICVMLAILFIDINKNIDGGFIRKYK
jgi:hypothetical protein